LETPSRGRDGTEGDVLAHGWFRCG
jgi:hypothetical protein